MIFYEAPHKLTATVQDLLKAFGSERRVSFCRELTKLHEEVLRMTLGKAADYYAEHTPRGEYVLIVEGAAEREEIGVTLEQALERVRTLMGGGSSKKDAVRQVSQETGFPKNTLYDAAIR